ncbi:MAG: histidine phosphatase family protein [Rhodospirillaceae bacterium]
MRQAFKEYIGSLSAGVAGAFAAAVFAASAGYAADTKLSDRALVDALWGGGLKIYFRHAQTDWSKGDQVEKDGDWVSCDPNKMRQLSDTGRATAERIGRAMRALKIPVAEVISSEYCRAAETAKHLGLGPVRTTRHIMNLRSEHYVGGHDAAVRNARAIVTAAAPAGKNVVIVGHGNLMRAATGEYTDEAGAGVYAVRPGTPLGFETVAVIAASEWEALAVRFGGGN